MFASIKIVKTVKSIFEISEKKNDAIFISDKMHDIVLAP